MGAWGQNTAAGQENRASHRVAPEDVAVVFRAILGNTVTSQAKTTACDTRLIHINHTPSMPQHASQRWSNVRKRVEITTRNSVGGKKRGKEKKKTTTKLEAHTPRVPIIRCCISRQLALTYCVGLQHQSTRLAPKLACHVYIYRLAEFFVDSLETDDVACLQRVDELNHSHHVLCKHLQATPPQTYVSQSVAMYATPPQTCVT